MPKVKQFDEDQVLLKARELFREQGYSGTSMEDLVRVTGLNRSSLYDTFGDKHSLYVRALKEYSKTNFSEMSKALEKIASPKKKIQYIFSMALKEILCDPSNKGCFVVNATTELANQDKKVSNIACQNMSDMEDRFYNIIREGQDSGEIAKNHTARSMARYLFSSLNGLQVMGKTTQDKAVLEDVVKLTLSVLE